MADGTGRVTILCVNAGSSSLKLTVRDPGSDRVLVTGAVEGIGEVDARVWLRDEAGSTLVDEPRTASDHTQAIATALAELEQLDLPAVSAVGHRVVHGGVMLVAPTLIDAGVLETLRSTVPLAPLHLPPQIAAIAAVAARTSDLPQVACFDTAFHRRMPEIAQRFALPEWAWEAGIRRFGFHGLSYEHVVDVLGPASGRVVIAHLGNGASLAAVRDGEPVDTTMAFTPAAGVMMGTRTGDLDPGVLVYVMRERGMDADAIDQLVNHESGLLGVSGSSSDMRTLIEARQRDPRAERAIAMFCRSVRGAVGALAATLGGVDQLVFTGGIGERAPAIRAEICEGLEYLGISIDAQRNAVGASAIAEPDGACSVRVVVADENRVIARHTASVVRADPAAASPMR